MMDTDFIAEVSKLSAYINSFKKDCVAHNFRLVKIKLPPEIFTLFKIRTMDKTSVDDLKFSIPYKGIIEELCGVPVEEDWTLTQPRYVIEADGIDIL